MKSKSERSGWLQRLHRLNGETKNLLNYFLKRHLLKLFNPCFFYCPLTCQLSEAAIIEKNFDASKKMNAITERRKRQGKELMIGGSKYERKMRKVVETKKKKSELAKTLFG